MNMNHQLYLNYSSGQPENIHLKKILTLRKAHELYEIVFIH